MSTATAKRIGRRRKLRRIRENWILYLFLLPTFVWFVIFHYWPIYGIQIAFQNYKIGQAFGSSQWVGLKYFRQFFSSYWFPTVMRNTVTISLLGFALSFPLPIVLALLLNEVSHEGYKKTVQTITYAPHFISTVVLCGALQLFLSPTSGLIGRGVNAIRQGIGLADVNILMDGPAFKWVYVLSGVSSGVIWCAGCSA